MTITKHTDLAVFMGQSNMAGRGDAAESPVCRPEAGAEYRAVSAPGRLYPITEPFGRDENRPGGIHDGTKKTGSMVSAFVNEYFRRTGHFLTAVSASQGGTTSAQWAACLARDAAQRLRSACGFLAENGYVTNHIFLLWCQGESDGDHATDEETYRANFEGMWSIMRESGAELCFLIQTGHFNAVRFPEGAGGRTAAELESDYRRIHDIQGRICAAHEDVIAVADFMGYLEHMADPYHYDQFAYNAVGRTAAEHAAAYLDGCRCR